MPMSDKEWEHINEWYTDCRIKSLQANAKGDGNMSLYFAQLATGLREKIQAEALWRKQNRSRMGTKSA